MKYVIALLIFLILLLTPASTAPDTIDTNMEPVYYEIFR